MSAASSLNDARSHSTLHDLVERRELALRTTICPDLGRASGACLYSVRSPGRLLGGMGAATGCPP